MKKIIKNFLLRLGIVAEDELEEARDKWMDQYVELAGRINKLEGDVMEHDSIFRDCVELNHRMKKMEEFLGIKYVVEPPSKVFIGYKKKEKRKNKK